MFPNCELRQSKTAATLKFDFVTFSVGGNPIELASPYIYEHQTGDKS